MAPLRTLRLACLSICVLSTYADADAKTPSDRAQPEPTDAPYVNTWLVLGTFDNDPKNVGYDRDWIGEADAQPNAEKVSAGRTWRYFDDRLFSRNYDNYQDLFSYYKVKRGDSVAGKVAYAHVYVHSASGQAAQLRIGADNQFKAWINGQPVAASTTGHPYRDSVKADASLQAGWNRLLLKIGNRQNGRFGFYARLSDKDGKALPGLTYSPDGGGGPLAVSARAMADVGTPAMPTGFREWPYVGADVLRDVKPDDDIGPYVRRKPEIALQASDFVLAGRGGQPPYRWSRAGGKLPDGLTLRPDGRITGTIAESARQDAYRFKVKVVDAAGQAAVKALEIAVKDRPNLWYEQARLTALIHHPEAMPEDRFGEFARLMKRQGYGVGMVISYNNGRHKYRWPSIYQPDCPVGDLVGKYKAALESAGVRFGMYIGNLNGSNHGGDNGAILLVEDAIRRYRPAAFWFDWAGWHGPSQDAIYSMIRSYDPATVIVLNGIPTMCNGDWDVIVLEGWGAWGQRHWDLWPFQIDWPKRQTVETWRLVADPEFEASPGIWSDWRDYLRLQMSLIGEGFIANIDHSSTIRMGEGADGRLTTPEDSHVWLCHRQMANWANPPGRPSLVASYTNVNPGPLRSAEWGYNTINLARDTIYLHVLSNPRGKTGMPAGGRLTVGPVLAKVKDVCWMNKNAKLPFKQDGKRLTVHTKDVIADTIDTIIKVELAEPHPPVDPRKLADPRRPVPPGNLASYKPAKLLSPDGLRALPASAFHFAHYGVDGDPATTAQGGNNWAWSYHVDLRATHRIRRIVIHFGRNYATEYKVLLSADGKSWRTVATVANCTGGTREHPVEALDARFIRLEAVKPNGPDQPGGQMSIAELEVYE